MLSQSFRIHLTLYLVVNDTTFEGIATGDSTWSIEDAALPEISPGRSSCSA